MTQLLEMSGITKAFPGVRALDGVDLTLSAGSIHALIGKNGAGKSTLIKIVSGVYPPDAGTITIDGSRRRFANPANAIEAGIVVVHQELSLVPRMSVAENVFLGRWPRRNGRIDWVAMRAATRSILSPLDATISPDAIVGELGIAQQQIVEIGKALSRSPRVLVLDEPTSALPESDAGRLMEIVRDLARRGVGVVYISHRLAEVEALADHLTVLRDGRTVAATGMTGIDRRRMVALMLGEELAHTPPAAPSVREEVALSVRGLRRDNALRDVSFDLHKGEILGIAGLVGAGRTELARAIFGADRIDAGSIAVAGNIVRHPTPRRMRQLGVAFLPEDRRRQALLLGRSVRENLALAVLDRLRSGAFISKSKEAALIEELIATLHIAAANREADVRTLSGGNQQKIVMGRWLAIEPSVLILDEPTRGIDVQAKAQIFRILEELAARGLAIIFISSELEEVLLISHRVLTMARGRIVSDKPVRETDLGELMLSVVL
jgi:ABC-type sugar transport system ATPase subunit